MTVYFWLYLEILLLIVILILFTLDNIKNIYQFEVLLEKIFRNFLRLEKTSLDFAKNFYNYLCGEVRGAFVSRIALFYTLDGDTMRLESISSSDGTSWDNILFTHLKESVPREQAVTPLFRSRIRVGAIHPDVRAALNIDEKRVLVLPVYYQKDLTSFYVLFFRNPYNYFRSLKRLILNSRKLTELVMDIGIVIREREQSLTALILSNIHDYAFITSDTSFRITSWNKGAEKMFGYDMIEVVDKTVTDIVHEGSRADFLAAVEQLKNREEVKVQIYTTDCTGTIIISDVVLKRILIGGLDAGLYIVIKDVTKEEVWKQSIKRQSMITKNIVENAKDGIVLMNEDSKIIYFNERFRSILDSGASYIGMELPGVFPPAYAELFRARIQELKSTENTIALLNIMVQDKWYNIRFFPIKSPEGPRLEGIIVFFIDNTFEMRTREKLEAMNNSLIENLQTAKMMHLNLIPSVLPQGDKVQFESVYQPSDEIGGDFYYVDEVVVEGRKYYLVLMADVSGHGIGSSMLTVLVKDVYSDFRNSLLTEGDIRLARFMKMLNRKIINLNMNGSKFVTAFILLLDMEKMEIAYSSAGHPHAILIRDFRRLESFGMDKSPPVGIVEEFPYDEERRDLKPHDKICLYSDGVLELFGLDVKAFNEYYYQLRKFSAAEIKADIQSRIADAAKKDDLGRKPNIDDITVVLTDITG